MRYIMTIIWSVLIALAATYVLTSMGGEAFVISDALLLAAVLAIVTFILGEVALKEKSE
ncbi:DUF2929 family protein [Oceanobacillus bengalensis]|uniref:DUF2929 family protein n=1 Tax=Oceanobacillus bengalensis TaxID=1435466 RepID=A0A494Z8B1_9BACI|nr:DUF2929 family protein [Oceanobacillus bengalensis]RKQ18851.1 DUF2929 family protein [Oceanobacillus bengalensis]